MKEEVVEERMAPELQKMAAVVLRSREEAAAAEEPERVRWRRTACEIQGAGEAFCQSEVVGLLKRLWMPWMEDAKVCYCPSSLSLLSMVWPEQPMEAEVGQPGPE
jgi:hypothetical protein